MTNVTENFISISKFNWTEYFTFCTLLGISVLIGIYYGCIKKNQNTVFEYMLGGKSMKILPIALSLITSHISGITFLGVPAETYVYGTQYLMICFSILCVVYITNIFYMPVLYPLQLNSLYEYLELRFSKEVRLVASLIFSLSVILHIPVIIYIPSLAFSQVTGVRVYYFAPIICLFCIFYTSIGGLKTIVWTDAIQGIIMVCSIIVLIILGVKDVNGIQNILQTNQVQQRLEFFDLNSNPFARNTFWTVIIGGMFINLAHIAIHPVSVQRFIALPSISAAKSSVHIYGAGLCAMKVLCVFIGLIIYTKYHSCDPIISGQLKRSGELIPYYIQEIAYIFPGLTGIFISGLISTALSTTSAGLNTLAMTMFEDFFSKFISNNEKNTKANFVMKVIIICTGCICILQIYVIEHLGAVLQLAISFFGVTQGSILAAFTLGIFCPCINKKGVIYGMISSVLILGWIILNAQVAIYTGDLQFATKPMHTFNCTDKIRLFNRTSPLTSLTEITSGIYVNKNVFHLYALSYMYYTPLGTMVAIIIAILVSWISNMNNVEMDEVNEELITPLMRRFISVYASELNQ